MAEPSGRHRLRDFLASRKHKHKHKRQPSDPEDLLRASTTSSVTSLPESAVVAMEGSLKKRLTKTPVMHDRYCVATWELDADERKRVMVRSYKSRKAYDGRPEKPSSVQQLKRISQWDGKTGFHRYQHAFMMETRDKKRYQCVAPCAADKVKWMGLLALNSRRDMRLGSVGNLVSLRRTQSVEVSADRGKPRAYTGPSVAQSDVNADQSTDTDELGHERLFRTTSGASANSLELPNGDKNEPVDWGLCGSEDMTCKYEVQEDSKPVLLDRELLDVRGETKMLATDRFLFEETGASRFGAVVVKGAGRDEEDDDGDFVDEDFAAREAQKEKEKKMKRRAQKLESNRDRYAEMAAARLAGMRKDARHPKKRHSLSHIRLSVGSEESDVEMQDDDQSIVEEVEGVAELEDANQRRSSLRSRRSSKSYKKSFVSSSENASSVNNGYTSGGDEEEVEEEDEEAVPPGAVISTQMAEAGCAVAERAEADIAEAEELRQLKKKYRAERRAKKRLMREKEEEERTALEAAELARAHREEQQAREEAKARDEQKKRDKKERREAKERLKREKAKQRQAEAEFQKLVELEQAEEERRQRERKEKKKKKSKKKEKYTSPAERIQRKQARDAERAAAADKGEAEVSNALVVMENSADMETVQQPVAAMKPSPAPALTSTSSAQTEAAPTQQVVSAPAPAPAPSPLPAPSPVPVPDAAPAVASNSAAEGAAAAAQAMPVPMYQMSPPPFVPSYPTCPHSMPAYGLAATFGAYPPFYLAPYSYGGPTGLQPALMRPNMGFVAGLSAMNSLGATAGPAPATSIQNSAEPMIGPQLPVLKESAEASSTGTSPSPFPTGPKLTNLPELPDVIEF